MGKIIASLISIASIAFGIVVMVKYGAVSEGALMTLGFLGMPLTMLGEGILSFSKANWLDPWIYYVLYFLQYQLIALFFLKWRKGKKKITGRG